MAETLVRSRAPQTEVSVLGADFGSLGGREVQGVHLDVGAELELALSGGAALRCRTDTEVIDWQWSVSRQKGGPDSTDFVVACLWAGGVEVPA